MSIQSSINSAITTAGVAAKLSPELQKRVDIRNINDNIVKKDKQLSVIEQETKTAMHGDAINGNSNLDKLNELTSDSKLIARSQLDDRKKLFSLDPSLSNLKNIHNQRNTMKGFQQQSEAIYQEGTRRRAEMRYAEKQEIKNSKLTKQSPFKGNVIDTTHATFAGGKNEHNNR